MNPDLNLGPNDDRSFDPYEPELGSMVTGDADEETVTKTGTTTVGLATEEGVVIATDRRASLGGRFVSNKNVVKVEQIHPTAAMTLVGSVGGAQSFIRTLRSEASLYETRRGEPMRINALATLAGNFARGGPFLAINPILGGVDEDGSHVYSIDPAGGVMEDDYTVTGSGMALAYGTLEGEYDPEMSLEDARDLATRAVQAASERDTGSGNGLALAEITAEGVDIETFDVLEDALED
ncbi:MAG: archaeal proteasome endopeptidase complex subunit beta [Halorhabdus sp.]